MSKALSRVRALVSEIDAIQTQGRQAPSAVPLMKAVQAAAPVAPEQPTATPAPTPVMQTAAPVASEPVPNNVIPLKTTPPEGKVFIQLTGKIAVQLQLEHTEEIVEVRQQGETIEIRFTDGKAIHLPLKNVA